MATKTRREALSAACAAARRTLLLLALVSALAAPRSAAAGAALKVWTDSRAPHYHRITLYDSDGTPIRPDDERPKPYSPRATCGRCHDYDVVCGGWHFNAARPDGSPVNAPSGVVDAKGDRHTQAADCGEQYFCCDVVPALSGADGG